MNIEQVIAAAAALDTTKPDWLIEMEDDILSEIEDEFTEDACVVNVLELLVSDFVSNGGMEAECTPAYDKLVDYCEAVGNDLAIQANSIAQAMGSEFWY